MPVSQATLQWALRSDLASRLDWTQVAADYLEEIERYGSVFCPSGIAPSRILYLCVGVLVRYDKLASVSYVAQGQQANSLKSIAQIPVPVARSIARWGFLIRAK